MVLTICCRAQAHEIGNYDEMEAADKTLPGEMKDTA